MPPRTLRRPVLAAEDTGHHQAAFPAACSSPTGQVVFGATCACSRLFTSLVLGLPTTRFHATSSTLVDYAKKGTFCFLVCSCLALAPPLTKSSSSASDGLGTEKRVLQ